MAALVPTQKRNLPLLATRETCAGKTYIVTGANTGLGLEAAKHLANLGAAKVILAVRNSVTGEAAKAEIDKAAGTADTNVVEVWPLDLSSFDSVRAFAKRAASGLDRIDALIENASLALEQREMAEGHIKTVTVNVLGTYLLASLLLPEMSRQAKSKRFDGFQPRVVIVGSTVGFDSKENWDKIKADPIKGMDEIEPVYHTLVSRPPTRLLHPHACIVLVILTKRPHSYPLTKLTESFATRHLARELLPVEKTGVIINLVCPGLCVTKLGRNLSEERMARLRELHVKYGRTAEDGSRTLLHAAVAGVESHGKLLHSCEDGE
jgi:NAD(P)-dependent dehydrogenase (short-subunit alcohol dehydrogenase family)